MKKIVLSVMLAIVFGAVTALAQMPDRPGGMEHERQGGMMSPEMIKDMSDIMNHMTDTMRTLSHRMDQKTAAERRHMEEVSRIIDEMSGLMHELSQHVAQGRISRVEAQKMQERITALQERMKEPERGHGHRR